MLAEKFLLCVFTFLPSFDMQSLADLARQEADEALRFELFVEPLGSWAAA